MDYKIRDEKKKPFNELTFEQRKELVKLLGNFFQAGENLQNLNRYEKEYFQCYANLKKELSKMEYIDNLIKEKKNKMEEVLTEANMNPKKKFSFHFNSRKPLDLKNFLILRKLLKKIDQIAFNAYKYCGELSTLREKINLLGCKLESKDRQPQIMEMLNYYKTMIYKSEDIINMTPEMGDIVFFSNKDRFFTCKDCNKDIINEDVDDICWDCRFKNLKMIELD
jgi:hypothetical protein